MRLALVLIFSIATFFLTSANSAALALAMFVSGKENPSRNLRVFWGVALGAVAAVSAGTGSLTVIQTASIATAFPLMFLLLLVIYGTFKGLMHYRPNMVLTYLLNKPGVMIRRNAIPPYFSPHLLRRYE